MILTAGYAKEVIEDRWPEAEPYVMKDAEYSRYRQIQTTKV